MDNCAEAAEQRRALLDPGLLVVLAWCLVVVGGFFVYCGTTQATFRQLSGFWTAFCNSFSHCTSSYKTVCSGKLLKASSMSCLAEFKTPSSPNS